MIRGSSDVGDRVCRIRIHSPHNQPTVLIIGDINIYFSIQSGSCLPGNLLDRLLCQLQQSGNKDIFFLESYARSNMSQPTSSSSLTSSMILSTPEEGGTLHTDGFQMPSGRSLISSSSTNSLTALSIASTMEMKRGSGGSGREDDDLVYSGRNASSNLGESSTGTSQSKSNKASGDGRRGSEGHRVDGRDRDTEEGVGGESYGQSDDKNTYSYDQDYGDDDGAIDPR